MIRKRKWILKSFKDRYQVKKIGAFDVTNASVGYSNGPKGASLPCHCYSNVWTIFCDLGSSEGSASSRLGMRLVF